MHADREHDKNQCAGSVILNDGRSGALAGHCQATRSATGQTIPQTTTGEGTVTMGGTATLSVRGMSAGYAERTLFDGLDRDVRLGTWSAWWARAS